MRNFQDTFDTRKQSIVRVFSICITVPLSTETYLGPLNIQDGLPCPTSQEFYEYECNMSATQMQH